MKNVTYQSLAAQLDIIARANGATVIKQEWIDGAESRIELLMGNAPHGSGIDSGIQLDDSSTAQKLVFTFGFHHMNDNGMYDGWTYHTAIVTPDLQFGYRLKITGRDRNQIKEYLHEIISFWLDSELPVA